ncbi:MAG: hypothetical protein EXX96DRAFT_632653 [Benjaminiella poitrasii]|nr:MAG: hypothetical protein EXX96DRAFT_632653 [Benjaminiella poitrasii]
MSNNFFYKDGQGRILDEQGNNAVGWEEEVDPYNLGTLLTLSHYRAFQNRFPTEDIEELDVQMEELAEELPQVETSGKKYNMYSNSQKSVFYYFNRIKLCKAAPSGRKTNIEPRAAQIWAKRLGEDPSWNIYEKQTNNANRKPSQLQQEHKQHHLKSFDNYP